jgi:tetratricopeptide (TPR) repeat protein
VESGGEPDALAVSLAASLDSPLLQPADAARRLYALMGRLPDGLARRDAEVLLPGCGNAAAACLLRTRLVHPDGDRLRMLVPIREHAAASHPAMGDMDALHAHYLSLAAELRRYSDGDYRGVELARLCAELVNLEVLIADAANTGAGEEAQDFQRELGNLSIAIGDARHELAQLVLARQNYLQAMNVFLALTSRGAGNAQWQCDLSISWTNLGEVRSAQGDLPGAPQAYTAAKDIADKLAAADPGNAQWQRDLVVSHWNLADLLERTPERTAEPSGHWSQALAIARALADTGRLAPTDAYFVETLQQRLAATRGATEPPP